ncbi:MAG TPA: rod shape-determining protein RodA [Candidatus Paceibacterota bacterium]|nr:rod shape-determining protein RodA [Candidatus Paceibacterota bacterium]
MKRLALQHIDWWIVGSVIALLFFSTITMASLGSDSGYLIKQSIWAVVAISVLIVSAKIDMSFLKKSSILSGLFISANIILVLVILLGKTAKGATSWFNVGGISFQPSDLVKIVLILIMAKYLSRRHVEIADMKHLLITGIYCFIPFVLVFLQPDFGSAIIFGCIWFGMMMVSGLSKKHLLLLTGTGLVIGGLLWGFVFKPYQKARIMNFLNPLADIRGTGYNAYQSMIAVGSGQLIGKGVGFGTQSRLNFLPEYQTDFIFAAFAEEWGFIGSLLVLICYSIILWRIVKLAMGGTTNFETLVALGIGIYFASHIIINVGMNIGLLPVTGITLPFMSYGGSHLIAECLALGILFSLSRNRRGIHREDTTHEFLGA